MINRVFLIGRLTGDPSLRYLYDGTAVSNFSIAVERSYKDKSGNKEVDFVECAAWRKLAELIAEKLGKGRLVGIIGRLQQDRWNDNQGQKRTKLSVVVDEIQFLDWPKDGQAKAQEQNYGGPGYEDDLPF